MENDSLLLSKRGGAPRISKELDPYRPDTYGLWWQNHWSPTNPTGNINLTTSDNRLCFDLIGEKVTKELFDPTSVDVLHRYPDLIGNYSFRCSAAAYIQRCYNAEGVISPDDLCQTPGVSGAFDMVGCAIADPGDVFLSPSPIYYGLMPYFYDRAQVEVAPFPSLNLESGVVELSVDVLRSAHKEITNSGKRVRALLLVNPNNPTGRVYSKQEVLPLLHYCKESGLAVLINEIYGTSAFDKNVRFESVLSWFSELPDPQRTIWFWGISKDFCMPSLRVGIIHSTNRRLIDRLTNISEYQSVSRVVTDAVEKLITDIDWIDTFQMQKVARLNAAYKRVTRRLDDIGVEYIKSYAGFFLLCDFRKFLKQPTFAAEKALSDQFKDAGVFMIAGYSMLFFTPGWFRLVFTAETEHVDEGLNRIEKVLTTRI